MGQLRHGLQKGVLGHKFQGCALPKVAFRGMVVPSTTQPHTQETQPPLPGTLSDTGPFPHETSNGFGD